VIVTERLPARFAPLFALLLLFSAILACDLNLAAVENAAATAADDARTAIATAASGAATSVATAVSGAGQQLVPQFGPIVEVTQVSASGSPALSYAYGSICPLEADYIRVPANITNLRLRAAPDGAIIGYVVTEQCYRTVSVDETRAWVRVETSSGEGWISLSQVEAHITAHPTLNSTLMLAIIFAGLVVLVIIGFVTVKVLKQGR
jgi:hypothetical protein